MKSKNLFYVLVAIMCLFFVLTGCNKNTGNIPDEGNNEDTKTYYIVTFDSQGGSAVESQKVLAGNPVRSPQTPTRENFSFNGWYKSTEENAVEWKFSTDKVNSDLTLYAKWRSNDAQGATASLTYERNENGYTVTGSSGQEEKIIIPAEYEGLPVTEIKESAFAYSRHTSGITYVSIPDTVAKIGLNAFYGRLELSTIDIGGNSNLAIIERNAFSGNRALKTIYIPQGVTQIGDSAFNNCGLLESISVAPKNMVYRSENGHLIETATQTLIRGANNVNIPDGIKIIAPAAFRKANSITELKFPKSVENIGNYIIADSTIEKINYAGTKDEWDAIEKGKMWNMGKTEIEIVFMAQSENKDNLTEVFMTFGGETITAQLYDNATARDFVSRLPLTLSFSDFNSTEKITYLPSGDSALDTSDAPNTFTPEEGDITVYIPWGNIAIFYHSFRESSGLAPFGKIDSEGIAKLSKISNNTQITITKEKPVDDPKILVAYFSCTNNTERVAKEIAQSTKGTLFEITPTIPYTSADLNYSNSSCRANREQNDATARPKISSSIDNIEQYDVIFIGYPIWWGQAPKIIYTFFESFDYDFAGVTIIPFCTSGSSGIGTSAKNLQSLAPSANWKAGARISGTNVDALIAQMN